MKAFISFSPQDASIAQKIHKRLIQKGISVWRSDENIKPGQSISEGIKRAIKNSDALIIVLSRSTKDSKWQSSEIALSLAEQMAMSSKRVLPVVVEKGVEIPFFLRDRLYCDLSDDDRFERNFPKLLDSLVEPIKSKTEQMEILKAQQEKLNIQKKMLSLEKSYFKRKLSIKQTYLSIALGILALLSALIILITMKQLILKFSPFKYLTKISPFALGIVVGILGTLLLLFAYKLIQKRSARKEVDHGKQ